MPITNPVVQPGLAQKPHSPAVAPLRFGFWGHPLLTRGLTFLESKPLAELVFKDVTGFNLPKIALVRTQEERPDVATLEFSNTLITLSSSLVLPRLLRYPVSWISKVPVKTLAQEFSRAEQLALPTAVKLARMGNAFGFFFPFAAAFWAVPFFRNWLTQKRMQNKGYSYEQMIGLGNGQEKNPKRSPQEEMRYQINKAVQVFGIGSVLGAASLLFFSLAARGAGRSAAAGFGKKLAKSLEGKKLQKYWRWFYDHFELKGKGAFQIASGAATLIFWGAPAYAGWLHGARSGNEFKERALQTANGLFGFSILPYITDWLWKGRLGRTGALVEGNWDEKFKDLVRKNIQKPEEFAKTFKSMVSNPSHEHIQQYFKGTEAQKQALTRLKNMRYGVSGLLIPVIFLGLVQLLNFHLTQKREEKKRQQLQHQCHALAHASAGLPPIMPYGMPFSQRPVMLPRQNPYQRPSAIQSQYQPFPQSVFQLPAYNPVAAQPAVNPSAFQIQPPQPMATTFSQPVSYQQPVAQQSPFMQFPMPPVAYGPFQTNAPGRPVQTAPPLWMPAPYPVNPPPGFQAQPANR